MVCFCRTVHRRFAAIAHTKLSAARSTAA
jgi:hypothetical protein